MSSIEEVALLIFAKAPIVGTVKTRMQPLLGEANCLTLHKALLCHTLRKIAAWGLPGLHPAIFFTGAGCETEKLLEELPMPSAFSVETQIGQDLGERLAHALSKKWAEGFRKILFIGTDSPQVGLQEIQAAIEGLTEHEVVLGPARDGGYYLIGFSSPKRMVLAGIDWGTPRVYEQTVRLLTTHSIKWLPLQENFDLDTFDDLLYLPQLMRDATSATCFDQDLLSLIDRIISQVQPHQCR